MIKADGTVQLYGNKVSLQGGGGVSLNGAVNYQSGAGAAMPEPQAAAPLVPQEMTPLVDENAPAIYNLAWSLRQVPVGQKVQAMFSVKNFRGGETATVSIYEWDGDGQKDLVDTLTFDLEDGSGHYSLPWNRTLSDAAKDLARDKEKGETGPLEYRFEVEVAEAPSAEVSNGLWLTQTLQVNCKTPEGNSMPDGTQVVLSSAGGQKLHATTMGGKAEFYDVVVGPAQVSIIDHDHKAQP